MKVLLMHRERDFLQPEEVPHPQRYRNDDPRRKLSQHERALLQDLELETVLGAMARGDPFVLEIALKALFSGLSNDVDTILYRQAVLKDCLQHAAVVRQLYHLTVETIEARNKHFWWGFSSSRIPSGILSSSVDLMEMFMGVLRTIRAIAAEHAQEFASEGFVTLFTMLQRELTEEYLTTVKQRLHELRFRGGVLVSAEIGIGNAGTHYVLRQPRDGGVRWLDRILRIGPPAHTFRIHPRDEAGARIVSELRGRGINGVANALAQSTDHVLRFFEMLRVELAFYIGCLNLHDALAAIGAPMCFPEPHPAGAWRHRCRELYDVSLALTMGRRIVGNTVDAEGKRLVIITGANRGGKSSFLRSVGLAQLMMQCGMFVGAESFAADLRAAMFTHYKREEDATMKSGKLDEELSRMSDIADCIVPSALLLFNESFAATNEREGSEIARQVVGALLEKGVKVFFVTHLYEFAHSVFERAAAEAIFLRAERGADGTRTFRLVEGEPLETSFGEDLYRKIFEAGAGASEGKGAG